jgi:hypothetical protein
VYSALYKANFVFFYAQFGFNIIGN